MRGPKPKPTARRVLEGNASHRPLPADEPKPPAPAADFDAPPLELSDHPAAIAEWSRLAPMLRLAGQVTLADRSALIALCLEWDRYLDATKQVQKHGLVVTTKTGYPMTNPYLVIATKALAGCNKLWPELGLTPSSRTRVKTSPLSPADDPFAQFDLPAFTPQ
jgi:P27 family predicted phage terminase small subunit